MISLTEQQLKDLLESAWWHGQETSRYTPNMRGSALKDCRDIIKDFTEADTDDGNGS